MNIVQTAYEFSEFSIPDNKTDFNFGDYNDNNNFGNANNLYPNNDCIPLINNNNQQ